MPDRIERARAQWADEEPGLDTSPMEVVVSPVPRISPTPASGVFCGRRLLDRSGFDVLATLRRSGPPYRLTPTALYRELVLTSGAMTHRVDALARAGLVERISGPGDRRSSLVGLTARGKSVADRAMAAHMNCEAAMIAPLPDGDRRALAAALRKLLSGIEEET